MAALAGCTGAPAPLRPPSALVCVRVSLCKCVCVCVCVYRRRSRGRWPGVSPGRWRLARLVCAGRPAGSLAPRPSFSSFLEIFTPNARRALPRAPRRAVSGVVFNFASFARYLCRTASLSALVSVSCRC